MPHDTIFALGTPPGRSAIAVIRISGPDTAAAILALTPRMPENRRASLRRLVDPETGHLLDEAIVIAFHGPRTETGEDAAELHLHGGKAVVRAVLLALSKRPNLRPAEPGEFAKRALENGKLDLVQLEGLADLIDAETEAQRLQAISEATGATSAVYGSWRQDALSALALVSSAIDFTDEADVAADAVGQAEAVSRQLVEKLASALSDRHRGEVLRDGFRVVIAGAPNAGKSSLLNALARREAAIVSDEAGTTRDAIEVRLDLSGWPVVVTDTAGLRETASKVEQEGIRRTLAHARRADLVLWLVEPGDMMAAPAEIAAPIITIETKADLRGNDGDEYAPHADNRYPIAGASTVTGPLRISTRTGRGLDALTGLLADRAKEFTGHPGAAIVSRLRHSLEIEAAHGHLLAFLDDSEQALEVRAECLRRAAAHIGRLTAHIGTEDVLGEIFSRFCIGK